MSNKYDYLIVGAGLFGATVAQILSERGKRCAVIEKRERVGGNIATEEVDGITVHKFGAHIFHTDERKVWEYVNRFAEFDNFVYSPIASCKGKLYNLPFNMFTFYQMFGSRTPAEARAIIDAQCAASGIVEPKNFEEKALATVGEDLYRTLIKGFIEKQWGRDCKFLPVSAFGRVPLRFTFDNGYYTDRYRGVPVGGYSPMVEKMLENAEVLMGVDYLSDRKRFDGMAELTVYTGEIDRFYGYRLGELEYRSLRFETETLDIPDCQGSAVVDYTEYEVPYTRIIEHKHFDRTNASDRTVITREYPEKFTAGADPYYPINDEKNDALYAEYAELAASEKRVLFGGRLAEFKYYDMDETVARAMAMVDRIIGK